MTVDNILGSVKDLASSAGAALKNTTVDNILGSVKDLASSAGAALKNTTVAPILAGAGGGGTLAGLASFMSRGSDGETPAEKRRRVLRDALMGSAFGAGIGYTLPTAIDAFATANPPKSEDDKSLEKFHQAFAKDKPLGGYTGSLGGAAVGLGTDRWLAWRQSAKEHAGKVKAEAASWWKNWDNSTDAYRKDQHGLSQTKRQTVKDFIGDVSDPKNLPHNAQAKLFDRALQHYGPTLDEFRRNWGKVKLPGLSGGNIALEKLMANATTTSKNLNNAGGASAVSPEQVLRRELLQIIANDKARHGGVSQLQKAMESRKGYTGPVSRGALRPLGWRGVLMTGAGAATPLIPTAVETILKLKDLADKTLE